MPVGHPEVAASQLCSHVSGPQLFAIVFVIGLLSNNLRGSLQLLWKQRLFELVAKIGVKLVSPLGAEQRPSEAQAVVRRARPASIH